MPPKSTPASAKTASIPNRPKNIDKHLKGTAAGGEGSGGLPSKDVYSQEQEQYQRDIDSLKTQVVSIFLCVWSSVSTKPADFLFTLGKMVHQNISLKYV